MNTAKIFSTLFFWVALYTAAIGQQLPFHAYSMRDGLLSDYVNCLYQDSRGFLWIGTSDGLSAFDGITFQNYTTAEGLSSPFINAIIEDERKPGTLWLGTNGKGLCKLVDNKITQVANDSVPWHNQIMCFEQDKRGVIWCGTGEGVIQIRNDSIVSFNIGSNVGTVFALLDTRDAMWIASRSGLLRCTYSDNTIHRISNIHATVSTLFMDGKNVVWAGTDNGEILKLGDSSILTRRKVVKEFINCAMFDRQENMWVGTDNGLFKITNGSFSIRNITRYTIDNGLQTNSIRACLIDNEKDIWFATNSKGIEELNDWNFYRYSPENILQEYNNTTASSDRTGHIWINALTSVWELWNDENGGWHRALHRLLLHGKIMSVTIDAQGRLWIASNPAQIKCYIINPHLGSSSDLKCVSQVSLVPFDPELICLMVDKDNIAWCSTVNNGVVVVDPKRKNPFIRYMRDTNGLPDNSIRAMYQDSHGNIWFGGYGQGLAFLSYHERFSGSPRRIAPRGGFLDKSIRAIIEDSIGRIWIGTRYGGIAILQGDSASSYSVKEGLSSNGVWAFAQSHAHRIMVGTQLGLEYADPHRMYFSQKADLAGSSVYACGITANGYAWFISWNGIALYKESDELPDTNVPPTYIRSFNANGREWLPGTDIRLPSNQNNCVIEYASISLRDAHALRYEYRLLNADTGWHTSTTMREVSYAALKPGAYTFQVRAINADGIPSRHPAELQFMIIPPYWQRWDFLAAMVLVLVIATALAIRFRVRRLLAIERIRSRIATDLHDDIGSGLTHIAIFSDVASRQIAALKLSGEGENTVHRAASSVQRLGDTARELMDAMSDVVWSIDPKQDSMNNLIARVRRFALEMCEGRNIVLSLTIGDAVAKVKLQPELKRSVLLLVKESLTNVVRHAQCTAVEIIMEIHEEFLLVSVADNGTGFDATVASYGNGLTNMRKRAEQTGGKFLIHSSSAGTRVEIRLPLW